MYKPKYFKLKELLPPMQYRNEEQGWELMDERLLETIDKVREIVGKPMICNTWHMDGNRRWSGFRPKNCKVGSPRSQHKLGRAADLLCYYFTAEEIRQKIDARKDELPYPVRIEAGVRWLHIDVKEMDYKGEKIYYFKA